MSRSPSTVPCIAHSSFINTLLHSGHLFTTPEPGLISIMVPSTSTSRPPRFSTSSWRVIFDDAESRFFGILQLSIFFTADLSSNVN